MCLVKFDTALVDVPNLVAAKGTSFIKYVLENYDILKKNNIIETTEPSQTQTRHMIFAALCIYTVISL